MADALHVYLNDRFAGRLREERGQFIFAYEPAWLESGDFIPLSVTMPKRVGEFPDSVARPFFENLLPEGQIRSAIARLKQVSARNTFALLGEIGGDCAGAVSLWPAGERPQRRAEYAPLSDERLTEILGEMQRRPLLVAEDELRLSLAGAQNKLPVCYDGVQLALPRGSAPSSHILKPGSPAFDHMPINEHFCMRFADALGLPVPRSELLRKPNPIYLVERYDRAWATDGALMRLHQIDFCQALNLPSSRKYEKEGGPSLAACFEVIAKYSAQPARDRLQLISWVIFNLLIGNADAHAKNLSLMIVPDGVRLAPFYDLLSTVVYPGLTDRLALKIGGENRPRWIQERHWEEFAGVSGANPRIVWQRINELARSGPEAAARLLGELDPPEVESDFLGRILKTVAASARRLSARSP